MYFCLIFLLHPAFWPSLPPWWPCISSVRLVELLHVLDSKLSNLSLPCTSNNNQGYILTIQWHAWRFLCFGESIVLNFSVFDWRTVSFFFWNDWRTVSCATDDCALLEKKCAVLKMCLSSLGTRQRHVYMDRKNNLLARWVLFFSMLCVRAILNLGLFYGPTENLFFSYIVKLTDTNGPGPRINVNLTDTSGPTSRAR